MPRPRRKSSNLVAEVRGDTGGPAVSTLEPRSPLNSPPLSPRPSSNAVPRALKRHKARSYFRRWKKLSFTHTWVNPLILICIILSLYAINPSPSNPLHYAIFLSYELPSDSEIIPSYVRDDPNAPVHYGKGMADFAFVAFYIIVLSFTREFLMQRLIRPMAIRGGIKSRNKQSRFMEQVYTAIYFSVAGPYGVYVMSRTPVWYFDTVGMYESYPNYTHDALFKAYYLLQASYWAQQAIVLCLQLEKPRKDFKELVGHHIVTLALIWLSYRFHFTYMGLAVYITHDISDFFLATSKTLNYLDSPITVPYFAFFMGVWVYLRHWINLRIIFSILTTFKTVGPFYLDWENEVYKSPLAQVITFTLLAALQALNMFWLYFILRVAYNITFAEEVADVRSDDETETEDASPKKKEKKTINGVAKAPVATGVEINSNGAAPELRENGHLMNGHAKKGSVDAETLSEALKSR